MSDISTFWDTSRSVGDWQLQGAALASGNDLSTAVLISLFTDRLANPDDIIPDGTDDPRGWWGNAGQEALIGSRLWLLARSKLTEEIASRARDYAAEALRWLQDDDVVADIEITTAITPPAMLGMQIVITEPDGKRAALNFSWIWSGINTFASPAGGWAAFDYVPNVPTGLTAVGGAGVVTLTWNSIAGLTYNLYWSVAPGVTPANGIMIAGVSSPFVHPGRNEIATYYYVLTAINAAGESSPSAQAEAIGEVLDINELLGRLAQFANTDTLVLEGL
jgi:phage gp46-like protein